MTMTMLPQGVQVSKEAALVACRICNFNSGQVLHRHLSMLGRGIESLFELAAFSEGYQMENPSIEGDDYDIELSMDDDRNWGYFSHTMGWITVDTKEITQYRFKVKWLINLIRRDLNLVRSSTLEPWVPDYCWRLGKVSLGNRTKPEVFFARRVGDETIFESMYHTFNQRALPKSIILTSSHQSLPLGKTLPGNHEVVPITSCLDSNSDHFHLDRELLQSRMKSEWMSEDGFSPDYRKAKFKGKTYSFTKKQAAIVEVLHKEGKMHKHALMLAANSTQNDPRGLFRKARTGEYHEAWGELILFDNRGYYWLDLS